MLKIMVSLVLIYVLVFTAAPVLASSQADTQSTEQVKAKVEQIGTGERARANVRLKNGTKLKGYIQKAGDTEFVLNDKDKGTSTTLLYSDVAKIERRKGHSTAKWVGIGVAIGAGAFLAILAIAFSQLND
ncbi:MAG TPA: hypothetical protein VF544_23785 [Pyrinomonadaceae bacterium]|jgi:hypothetical protein